MDLAESLRAEGLAAQLHAASHGGGAYVWWHLLREDLREVWRSAARKKIAEFEKRYPNPEEKK